MAPPAVNRQGVGFIGLGAMGSGMAAHLVKAGFRVCGYDVSCRLLCLKLRSCPVSSGKSL
jgi:3-hydroxyisobutyrate dehydrogenase-like beta-hydroxyacid dehydrogenase